MDVVRPSSHAFREGGSVPIETDCPGCARRLRVAEEFAGRQARCPICSHIYTVPSAQAPVGAAAAAESNSFGPLDAAFAAQPVSPAASPAAVEPVDWWLRTPEGVSYGPVTRSAMNRWVSEGRVTSDCMLRNAESAWEPADRRYPKLRETSPAGIPISPANRSIQYDGSQYGPAPYSTAPSAALSTASPIQGVAIERPSYQAPHRGTNILIMAIIGLVMGCPVLSIVAWVMGSSDLREINAGRMDREGLATTKAGYLIGMIYSLIWIGVTLLTLPLYFAAILAGSF